MYIVQVLEYGAPVMHNAFKNFALHVRDSIDYDDLFDAVNAAFIDEPYKVMLVKICDDPLRHQMFRWNLHFASKDDYMLFMLRWAE